MLDDCRLKVEIFIFRRFCLIVRSNPTQKISRPIEFRGLNRVLLGKEVKKLVLSDQLLSRTVTYIDRKQTLVVSSNNEHHYRKTLAVRGQ